MKSKIIITIEGLISIFLAIYLTSLDNIFISNYSIIGNTKEYRLVFMSWGLISNLFLLMVLYHFEKTFGLIIAFISGVLVTILPYLPLNYPILANIHILMGFISFATYNYIIYKVIFIQRLYNIKLFNKILQYWKSLLLLLAFFVAYYMHINSLIELTYNLVMFTLLTYIYWKLC